MTDRREIDTNFFTPGAIADPYSLYDQLRSEGSVVWNTTMHGWNVFGFSEVSQVLSDSGQKFAMLSRELADSFEVPNMVAVDGPLHRRLRNVLAGRFSRSAIAAWEQRVTDVVTDLSRPLEQAQRSYDLIADFTMVPTVIVADMLSVPADRYPDFKRWSHDVVSNLAWGAEDDQTKAVMLRASDELNAYVPYELEVAPQYTLRECRFRPHVLSCGGLSGAS